MNMQDWLNRYVPAKIAKPFRLKATQGVFLKEWRMHLQLSREDLARKTRVNKATISRLEYGYGLSLEMVTRLADAMGISVDDLRRHPQSLDDADIKTAVAEMIASGGLDNL